ncbi:hypothetical protein HF313_25470 [Massilia atriviolacea]|uniref:hypothetical protein n=1 Tax=Massilia atriviolacea TaxID=2495579 RepID=UPI0013DF05CD|nr:hypothetical protein [Massilia atriviolacea]
MPFTHAADTLGLMIATTLDLAFLACGNCRGRLPIIHPDNYHENNFLSCGHPRHSCAGMAAKASTLARRATACAALPAYSWSQRCRKNSEKPSPDAAPCAAKPVN